jgi:hypothetical protein
MKRIIFCFLLFMAAGMLNAQNSYYIEKTSLPYAADYNDYIVDMIDLVDQQWTLAIEDSVMESALASSKLMNDISGYILKTLAKLEGFNGDVDFKKSAINYITHMNKISKKELPEFIKIIRKPGSLTVAGEKRAEALIPILDDKREILFKGVEVAQNAFAKKNGITIVN